MANIGKTIRNLRTANKMTQDNLAEKLFVSRQTISNYETGKSNPDIDMLIKIADVFNSDVNTIIYGLPKSYEYKKSVLKLILSCIFTLSLGIISFILLRKTLSLRYSTQIHHLTLGLLITYFIMICPYVIINAIQFIQEIQLLTMFHAGEITEFTISHSYSFFPAWDFVAWKIMYGLMVWKLNILFVIPGAALQAVKTTF